MDRNNLRTCVATHQWWPETVGQFSIITKTRQKEVVVRTRTEPCEESSCARTHCTMDACIRICIYNEIYHIHTVVHCSDTFPPIKNDRECLSPRVQTHGHLPLPLCQTTDHSGRQSEDYPRSLVPSCLSPCSQQHPSLPSLSHCPKHHFSKVLSLDSNVGMISLSKASSNNWPLPGALRGSSQDSQSSVLHFLVLLQTHFSSSLLPEVFLSYKDCLLWLAVWWARPLQVCFPVLRLHSLILLKPKGKYVLQQQASTVQGPSPTSWVDYGIIGVRTPPPPRGPLFAIKSKAPPAAKGLWKESMQRGRNQSLKPAERLILT